MILLITNILFVILCIIEAFGDHYTILDMTKDEHNRKWHTIDFLYYFVLACFFSYYVSIYAGICLGLIRFSVFPFVLNRLRDKPTFYMSKKGIEGFLTKYIPSELIMIGSFITTIIITIWQTK